jgi:hypothetical protein
MTLNDLVHIMLIHHCVPNTFGIDDSHWASCAAIQAARLVHTHTTDTRKTSRFNLGFAMVKRVLCAMVSTAVLAVVALIQAEKNMVFVVRGLCHG